MLVIICDPRMPFSVAARLHKKGNWEGAGRLVGSNGFLGTPIGCRGRERHTQRRSETDNGWQGDGGGGGV